MSDALKQFKNESFNSKYLSMGDSSNPPFRHK